MDLNAHTTPDKLERYAFLWSLARMAIGALSLFFGAAPILYRFVGSGVMMLAWMISGAAALYLGYRWYTGGKKVFSGNDQKDTIAFLVMVVTGINLGYAGISTNISMSLVYSILGSSLAGIVFKATAVAYLLVAYQLFKRWKASGERVFDGAIN